MFGNIRWYLDYFMREQTFKILHYNRSSFIINLYAKLHIDESIIKIHLNRHSAYFLSDLFLFLITNQLNININNSSEKRQHILSVPN